MGARAYAGYARRERVVSTLKRQEEMIRQGLDLSKKLQEHYVSCPICGHRVCEEFTKLLDKAYRHPSFDLPRSFRRWIRKGMPIKIGP